MEKENQKKENIRVRDEFGTEYELESRPLAQGGQGAVYRVRGVPEILIKLIRDQDGKKLPQDRQRQLHQRLQLIRTLPIPEHVVMPLALLDDDLGYVMRMVRDVRPIRDLLNPPEDQDPADFFRDSGGLAFRLEVLENLAKVLASLHSVPLIYSDLSPNNVLYSPQTKEVWLIDSDNLHYSTSSQYFVFTPNFAAPEVEEGVMPATTLSDVWSFAVLAFYTLTLHHPFEQIEQEITHTMWDEEDEWGDDVEMIWLFHEERDFSPEEFPGHWRKVISPRLFELFRRTFEEGYEEIRQRPSMGEWVSALRSARAAVVRCDGCGHTYYALGNKEKMCPYCGEKLPDLLAYEVYTFITYEDRDELKTHISHEPFIRGVVSLDSPLRVFEWACLPGSGDKIVLEIEEKAYSLRIVSQTPIEVAAPQGKVETIEFGHKYWVRDSEEVWVYCRWKKDIGRFIKVKRVRIR